MVVLLHAVLHPKESAFTMAPPKLTLPFLLLSLLALTTSSASTCTRRTRARTPRRPVLQSPLGANSSFGSIGVVDDELRAGPDRASPLLDRPVGAGYLSSVTLVFTAGDYAGSMLSVQGPVLGFAGTIERAVVGGTGRFRLARGYMLFKMISKPTPETDVNGVHLFVLMHHGKY
ncbi:dirigent protein 21-like [Panicum miliaceum]|uniref:Dirigent protein n=1 Tax=Panicum miliaceum TaxID=4540 RepID=A0A3L6PJ36_PANMI|nr:dirigent protein 21-like [Panicum miliaceum]